LLSSVAKEIIAIQEAAETRLTPRRHKGEVPPFDGAVEKMER